MQGVITPIVTPFDKSHQIDEYGLRNITQFLLNADVDGLVTCGRAVAEDFVKAQERMCKRQGKFTVPQSLLQQT